MTDYVQQRGEEAARRLADNTGSTSALLRPASVDGPRLRALLIAERKLLEPQRRGYYAHMFGWPLVMLDGAGEKEAARCVYHVSDDQLQWLLAHALPFMRVAAEAEVERRGDPATRTR